ncbi:SRPBCC family protein [Cytophagaceae bacterium ABcell3]|nr:SRPBCC family protein [Cytophagaceae bacterium ABcell3]
MKTRTIKRTTTLNRPIEEVFNFFSKAENLNIITPPEMQFKIISKPPIEIAEGTIIDYKIKLSGIPMFWRTQITHWEPMKKFVDKQIRGPYLLWEHQHILTPKGTSTEMIDIVDYKVPGWIIEPLVHKLFVSGRLKSIFDYRQTKCAEIFS